MYYLINKKNLYYTLLYNLLNLFLLINKKKNHLTLLSNLLLSDLISFFFSQTYIDDSKVILEL